MMWATVRLAISETDVRHIYTHRAALRHRMNLSTINIYAYLWMYINMNTQYYMLYNIYVYMYIIAINNCISALARSYLCIFPAGTYKITIIL